MISTQALSQIDLFAGLSEKLLATIADLCEEVSCAEGEGLFRESEKAKRLYFLLEGRVALQVQLTSRLENMTVTVIDSSGQGIGWSAVISPFYYTASALCQTNCSLVAINGQGLMQVLGQQPAAGSVVWRRIAELISSRLRDSRAAMRPDEGIKSRGRYWYSRKRSWLASSRNQVTPGR
jgi:CRP-like cAMP-binding protein